MYYASNGPIDYFYFTLTKEEACKNEILNTVYTCGSSPNHEEVRALEEQYDALEDKINETIFRLEKERPHTIRYFGLPNFDQCRFELCAVAKISNNGTTYLFSTDKSFTERYSNGYCKVGKM